MGSNPRSPAFYPFSHSVYLIRPAHTCSYIVTSIHISKRNCRNLLGPVRHVQICSDWCISIHVCSDLSRTDQTLLLRPAQFMWMCVHIWSERLTSVQASLDLFISTQSVSELISPCSDMSGHVWICSVLSRLAQPWFYAYSDLRRCAQTWLTPSQDPHPHSYIPLLKSTWTCHPSPISPT